MSSDNFLKIDKHINTLKNGESSIADLYDEDFVNWRGPTTPDSKKSFYTDYTARKLLEEVDIESLLDEIKPSGRKSYYVEGHDGVTHKSTNRTEEIFAKSLLGHSLQHLGKVVGYQMPLKASREDSYGKIDLVSYQENGATAYLIELKMADKKETLLRASLEIAAYRKLINEDILTEYLEEKRGRFGISVDDTPSIRKAVVFTLKDSTVPKELQPEYRDDYQNLRDLLSHLDVGVFTIPFSYPVDKYITP